MSHKVQAHQAVRILTLQIAVPAELVENGLAEEELSEKLSALGTDHAESAILDWRYVTPPDETPEFSTAVDPEEGEVFNGIDVSVRYPFEVDPPLG